MGTLLTARQLQDLLQVDRITIYRMLNDGRLQGFKVGGQWRFSREAIARWLHEQQASLGVNGARTADHDVKPSSESLPLSCIQAIQGIFAEALGVGTVTTGPDGNPVTAISNSCEFCNLILGTEVGRLRCVDSWRAAAAAPERAVRQIATCHAGLGYVWAPIVIRDQLVAATHAGQFLDRAPGADGWSERIASLSAATGLEPDSLRDALSSVPILGRDRQEQVPRLLSRVAETFSEIGEERLRLLGRLQRIAEMTQYP
jgi:excisionase family DNA binding protein